MVVIHCMIQVSGKSGNPRKIWDKTTLFELPAVSNLLEPKGALYLTPPGNKNSDGKKIEINAFADN